MAISTIAEIEHLHNVHSGSPQTTQRNPPQITKIYSMIFKQQLTDISTVLNNTGNTTKLLTSFNALDIAQQKVLLSSSLLSEKQKEQCITMATLSAANTKYTAEQLAKATGISTETLANWGLIESTDALTISELSQRAASDAQAKAILDKIIAQNAEAVANGKIIASNTALTASEGGATLATGAFTTAIKANIKAMITWMTTTPLGWLTMLVGGVFLAVKAYDALTVSVKEQKEKMEDSLSAYKDAKSELSNITTELENQEQTMDDLLAKEKLTYAEQGQLEELQAITRELRIQKDLAEKEEGRTQKEVAKDASDLFNKQFGKYDISEDAIGEYQNNANITGNNAILISDENDISSMIAGYRQFNDLLDEAYGSESQEDIDHFKSLTEGLKDSIFETAQELQEQQSNIADYYNTIKDIPYDDLTTEQKGIVDSYNSISDAIELIYQQLDSNTWKSMQIESVFDTEGIEKTKEELIEMVKAGEFDESTLQSYPKLSAALEQNKVSASELRNELEALAEAEGNVKGDTFNDKNPISSTITSSIEQIATQLEPQFQKLGDAYKNIFTADGFTLDAVDNSMLEDLRKTFTEIEEEIGVTFDTTQLENFFAVLSNSNSTAEQTQEAFNNIATSYLYSTDVLESLNSTTVDSIAKQLESLGITNASQLATEALAAKEEYLAFARREHTDEAGNLVSVTQDLANATADDINVLLAEQGALEGEGIALDETTQKMIAYWIQKQAANGQLSTVGDIQQLSALCEGLGVSSKALRNYIYFKKLASMTDVYDAASIERFSANAEKNMEQAQADIQSIYGKLGGAEINFAVPDTSKKSKSEKDTTKEFDWVEQAIENVEKEVNKLDEIVNSAYSTFSQKNEALAKEIGKVNEEIELQQQAYDEYMRKADSIGLSEDYKTLIHDGAINIENISDEKLQKKISEYQQWYEKAVDASDAISELSTKVKDLHVAGYELQTDRLEELLDNEAITEKQYLSEMKKLYKEYYENQVGYAQKAHEAKLALLDREKQYLNSVANAATSLLDKEISKVQDNAKEQQKPYEDQIKAAEKQIDAYEDQIKLFEKQIDAHNKQIDAYNKEIDLINDRKKPLQDELDALEDKAREENLILSLQEKQYNLKKAENQKDKLVNYMPDTIVI